MEGKALQEPPFRVRLVPCDRFVERGDSLHHGNDVGALRVLVPQTVVLEEPPAQHFGHVLLADGLHALFALPPEDVEQFRLQPLADLVALLLRIGRQQRRHHRRPIHLRDRLRQILKKSTIRSRQIGSAPAFSRAYISTSSTRIRVDRPRACGRSSSVTRSGSAGGVSRSSASPVPWMARSPSAPPSWKASTLQGWRSVRVSPSGPRTPSIPRSMSILSKQSEIGTARGSAPPARNSRTAGRPGSASGFRNRWYSVISVCVLPPP